MAQLDLQNELLTFNRLDYLRRIVQAICLMIEMRDPYTAIHQKRVAKIASAITKELNWEADQIEHLCLAASIHDLGKIAIPLDLLTKAEKLTKEEYDLVKTHVIQGHTILKNIPYMEQVAEIILQHHERLDGSGYPFGLSGNQVIAEARVLAVADIIDSMASDRPYRSALGLEKAFQEISKRAGKDLDTQIVTAALKVSYTDMFPSSFKN